uniref:Uncharacterized protein n=1 Tax=Zea mays TaxID=4577 RepID=C0HEX2_MAIZE|nr:unknown [Zea mays]
MTMHEISSLLILPRASDVSRFAAVCGSLVDFTRSTASWFFITFHNPSLASMTNSVLEFIFICLTSGSELKCALRL